MAREAAAAAERAAARIRRHRRVHAPDAPRGRGRPGPDARADGGAQGGRRGGRRRHGLRADDRGRRPVHRRRPDPAGRAGLHRRVRRSPAADVEVAAERDFQYCTEVRGPRRAAAPGQRGRGPRSAASADRSSWPSWATSCKPMCIPTPPTPSLPMCPAGAAWRRPRPRTCGPSTGACSTACRSRSASSPTAPADLPDAVLDRHRISLVPLQVIFGDEVLLDRVELKPEEFYRRMRPSPHLPTHLPAHGGGFRPGVPGGAGRGRRRDRGAGLLGSLGHLSVGAGRDQGGRARRTCTWWTASRPRSAPACWRCGRRSWRSRAGRRPTSSRELERVRDQSGVFLTVDKFDNLLRCGRVSRGKAWIGGLLDVKPILSLDTARPGRPDRPGPRPRSADRPGALAARGASSRRGRSRSGSASSTPRRRTWPSGCATRWWRPTSPRDCFVSLATGVLGTHVGEGAWAVFYQVEDGTPPAPPNPRSPG